MYLNFLCKILMNLYRAQCVSTSLWQAVVLLFPKITHSSLSYQLLVVIVKIMDMHDWSIKTQAKIYIYNKDFLGHCSTL